MLSVSSLALHEINAEESINKLIHNRWNERTFWQALSYNVMAVQSLTLPHFYMIFEGDLKLSWIRIIHMRKKKKKKLYLL